MSASGRSQRGAEGEPGCHDPGLLLLPEPVRNLHGGGRGRQEGLLRYHGDHMDLRPQVCLPVSSVTVPLSTGRHVRRGSVSGRSGLGSADGGRNPSPGEHRLPGGEQLRRGGEPGL